ncbi:malonate decarboxylase holo-[acyl-carrier-protein] synthase [Legionella bononiensis]|uniref:Malonate decarboxylase holo-[acyl-carrier-protein] synthase n=1 Tax=Legionella bononiensis TaxID=2793102 RepID=A0ABS1W9C4_9GAMM|nr:malonate decarboxylase holo-[acyl-carrier-protein] synthase [Legionella bononiensis]MBL7480864.1 malonate decarboxylase holo-[acyl-carrier-protein] synthase [Legionella bononiensis]MBL7525954.1 malonate decarboxylase holo-[acyl-carrier-protein] synthase [Legionella bononiensis]MBL7563979.1 malonate decarboxylase holo-[acyl-carrier-protein] synthase [Legionella bononiensis]
MNQRHQLIYVTPNASFKINSSHENNQEIIGSVASWLNKGLPCIYTRQLINDELEVHAGLSLLLGNKKYRASITLNKNDLITIHNLPTLSEMSDYWYKKLEQPSKNRYSQLDQSDLQSTSVYGSYLFEYLSNQPFVNKHSDLDLLIDYDNFSLPELNRKITHFAQIFGVHIDGEVRFHDIGDIAFNELMNSSANQFLFKNSKDIGLITRHELYEQYPSLSRL